MPYRQQKSTIVRTPEPVDVHLRPVPPGAAGPMVDTVFAGLSAGSRYLRFHAPVLRLTEPVRRRLADLDGRHRAAVVAEVLDGPTPTTRTPIGMVWLVDLGAGAVDVGIAVVDRWQRRGVGRRLLLAATELAEALGYAELRGSVLPENDAMRRLARRAFPHARPRWDGDALAFAVPIGAAAHTVTHEDVLADLLFRGG